MPNVGDKVRLTIESLTSTGQGVGRLGAIVIFVNFALPEEIIECTITEVKKTFAKAKLLQVIKPSPKRMAAPCTVFGVCGGCQLQHLSYQGQLNAKKERVQNALIRIAKISDVEVNECIPSPKTFNYRNKITLQVGNVHQKPTLGLYKIASNEHISITCCPIHCEFGEEVFQKVQQLLQNSPKLFNKCRSLKQLIIKSAIFSKSSLLSLVYLGNEIKYIQELAEHLFQTTPLIKGVAVCTKKKGKQLKYETVVGSGFIEEKILEKTFKISAASFFQVNPSQAENLYSIAIDYAKLDKSTTVIDAYAGVGVIAILMAENCKNVVGFETIKDAVKDAKINAQLNDVINCQFKAGKAENLLKKETSATTCILNPPRIGCDRLAIDAIGNSQITRIVYISCDPETLARDLKTFSNYNFKLKKIQPVDMFPQTMHIETVALLTRI